jgi:preprotein translocase SecE subunit
MAKINKPKIRVKKQESVRERADKQRQKQNVEPRRKKVASAATKPVKGFGKLLTKEYNPLKIKKGKYSKVLGKRINLVPSYFKTSFKELKEVQWLTPKQAASLTFAVIIFSVAIALFVQLLGYGFDKLFKEVILK